jgi:hypothetical protein
MKPNPLILSPALMLLMLGCGNNDTGRAKEKADMLWRKIENGDAAAEFSEQYFPKVQTEAIIYDLRNKCDFKNRTGGYVGSSHFRDLKTSTQTVRLAYEYFMKCDSVRFILSYRIDGDQVELFNLKMEPTEKRNSMLAK